MTAGYFTELPRNTVLIGDACARLAQLPAHSVDCVITSPPYFALRDYGQDGQLGLETTVDDWVHNLIKVGSELKRILKPTGGFWLNVGDSYSHDAREGARKKSLLLGPQRLSIALAADGWLVRNHVIWAKTNPMPSNVTDRLSNTHESLYFFTRDSRYFFDLNAIREPHKDDRAHGRARKGEASIYPPPHSLPRRSGRNHDINTGLDKLKEAGVAGHPLGKNPGDVWPIGTAAFHGEHFATFPTALVERPLLATCPERVCVRCGVPWQRAKQAIHDRLLAVGPLRASCGCRAEWRPGIVLDPFMGTGTVALVAEQHERDWVGVELSPAYAALAERRLREWREANK
jgi:DNA modification methylase